MANVHLEEELYDALSQHVSCSEESRGNELGIVQLQGGDFLVLFTKPGLQKAYYVASDGTMKPASTTRIQRALEAL